MNWGGGGGGGGGGERESIRGLGKSIDKKDCI